MPTTARGSLPERLLHALLVLAALTTLVFWLPTIRGAFDGASYEWGLFGLHGTGMGGHYIWVVAGSVFGLAIQYLGWRGARPPAHALLTAWYLFLLVGAIYLTTSHPADFRFRGDTMGIDFSLGWIAPLVLAAAVAGTVYTWIHRSEPDNAPLSWTRRNTFWAALIVILLPVQFVLLRTGEPSGMSDQAGVILTVAQWVLLGRAFRVY